MAKVTMREIRQVTLECLTKPDSSADLLALSQAYKAQCEAELTEIELVKAALGPTDAQFLVDLSGEGGQVLTTAQAIRLGEIGRKLL